MNPETSPLHVLKARLAAVRLGRQAARDLRYARRRPFQIEFPLQNRGADDGKLGRRLRVGSESQVGDGPCRIRSRDERDDRSESVGEEARAVLGGRSSEAVLGCGGQGKSVIGSLPFGFEQGSTALNLTKGTDDEAGVGDRADVTQRRAHEDRGPEGGSPCVERSKSREEGAI